MKKEKKLLIQRMIEGSGEGLAGDNRTGYMAYCQNVLSEFLVKLTKDLDDTSSASGGNRCYKSFAADMDHDGTIDVTIDYGHKNIRKLVVLPDDDVSKNTLNNITDIVLGLTMTPGVHLLSVDNEEEEVPNEDAMYTIARQTSNHIIAMLKQRFGKKNVDKTTMNLIAYAVSRVYLESMNHSAASSDKIPSKDYYAYYKAIQETSAELESMGSVRKIADGMPYSDETSSVTDVITTE